MRKKTYKAVVNQYFLGSNVRNKRVPIIWMGELYVHLNNKETDYKRKCNVASKQFKLCMHLLTECRKTE